MDQSFVDPCMSQIGETLDEERRHGFVFPIPGGAIEQFPTLVKDALFSLNRLAGTKFNDARQLFHRPLTAVQKQAVSIACDSVNEAGSCPTMTGREALLDMMKAHPTYGEPSNLAPFDRKKLKILLSKGRPKTLEHLLPPHVLPLLSRWKTHIELTAEEANRKIQDDPSCCPKKPYWDPKLRHDKNERSQLILGLWKVGVVNFRLNIKSQVGLFFVKKKQPEWIRMVVDCRICNAFHRQPPVTRLGSASSFADIEMNPDLLRFHFGVGQNDVGWGSELDVADCFYQFEMKQLSKWFGIDDPRTTDEWRKLGVSISDVFDEDIGATIPLGGDTIIYPVIGAMPMGWTWALFFANETVAHIARSTCVERPLECREKLPSPQLWDGKTFTSTYVDNVSVFGAFEADVQARMDSLAAAFERHNIPVTWTYDRPTRIVETVGVIVDFEHGVIRNKPSRLWKVHLAGRELCRRSKVRSDAVEVWLGHATSIFRLCPCLLSIFTVIYRFVAVCRGSRVRLWPAVKAEIMQATSLLWYARAKLDCKYINQVDMGDSSNTGYAMMTRSFPSSKIQPISNVKEKWRYVPMPEDFKSAIEFFNAHGDPESSEGAEHIKAFVRAGVGINTEYGQWLQRALEEGNWLSTSAIVSQFKAKQKRRDDVDVPAFVEPIPMDMVRPGSFRLLWMRKWRNPQEHINIKEGRVLVSSLKRSARAISHCGAKKLSLSDNLCCVLAFEKGRSSSSALNRLCKVSAAIQISLQIRWSIRHIETKRNLADNPSRGKRVDVGAYGNSVELDLETNSSAGSKQWSATNACRKMICLDTLLPPPGLEVPPILVRSTCGLCSGPEHRVSSAVDDHGHPIAKRRQKRNKGKGIRVVWEIFSGDGKLSKALKRAGCHVLTPIDIRHGWHQDVTCRSVQQHILRCISLGLIDYVHMGTPCTVFSRARRGITNLQKARLKERIGCELAFFSCEVARLCHKLGIGWSIENPQTSRLWEVDQVSELRLLFGVEVVDFPMCRFGTPYKKPTRLLTNCDALKALAGDCTHGKHSEVLKGTCWVEGTGYVNRTTIAGSYPDRLCRRWAQLISDDRVLRCHDSTELGTAFSRQIERPLTDQSHPSESVSEKGEGDRFPLTSAFPRLLESIVFGQHSKAEAARRRLKRQTLQKPKAEKTGV